MWQKDQNCQELFCLFVGKAVMSFSVSSLVKPEQIWLCPEELNLKWKKYFFCIHVDRRNKTKHANGNIGLISMFLCQTALLVQFPFKATKIPRESMQGNMQQGHQQVSRLYTLVMRIVYKVPTALLMMYLWWSSYTLYLFTWKLLLATWVFVVVFVWYVLSAKY